MILMGFFCIIIQNVPIQIQIINSQLDQIQRMKVILKSPWDHFAVVKHFQYTVKAIARTQIA